jgi:hypothetical protein
LAKERRKIATAMGAEFSEILSLFKSLQEIRGGNGHSASAYDPTINVKEGAEIERRHQAELRASDNKRSDDLDRQKRHFEELLRISAKELRVSAKEAADAVLLAERSRVDGTFGQLQNAVLVASKETIATAVALRENADRNTAVTNAAIKVLEEKQYNAGGTLTGREQQARENQYAMRDKGTSSRWIIGIIITGAFGFISLTISIAVLFSTHITFK